MLAKFSSLVLGADSDDEEPQQEEEPQPVGLDPNQPPPTMAPPAATTPTQVPQESPFPQPGLSRYANLQRTPSGGSMNANKPAINTFIPRPQQQGGEETPSSFGSDQPPKRLMADFDDVGDTPDATKAEDKSEAEPAQEALAPPAAAPKPVTWSNWGESHPTPSPSPFAASPSPAPNQSGPPPSTYQYPQATAAPVKAADEPAAGAATDTDTADDAPPHTQPAGSQDQPTADSANAQPNGYLGYQPNGAHGFYQPNGTSVPTSQEEHQTEATYQEQQQPEHTEQPGGVYHQEQQLEGVYHQEQLEGVQQDQQYEVVSQQQEQQPEDTYQQDGNQQTEQHEVGYQQEEHQQPEGAHHQQEQEQLYDGGYQQEQLYEQQTQYHGGVDGHAAAATGHEASYDGVAQETMQHDYYGQQQHEYSEGYDATATENAIEELEEMKAALAIAEEQNQKIAEEYQALLTEKEAELKALQISYDELGVKKLAEISGGQGEEADDDGNWVQCYTDDNIPYWFNSDNGESRWDAPSKDVERREMERQIMELLEQIREEQDKFLAAEETMGELRTQVEKEKEIAKDYQQEVENLQAQIHSISSGTGAVATDIDNAPASGSPTLRRKLKEVEERSQQWEQEMEALNDKLKSSSEHQDSLQTERDRLDSMVGELQEQNMSYQAELEEAKNHIKQMEMEVDRLQSEAREWGAAVPVQNDASAEQLSAYEAELQQARASYEELVTKCGAFEQKCVELEGQLQQVEEEKAAADSDVAQVKLERDNLLTQYNEAQNTIEELRASTGDQGALRTELQEVQKERSALTLKCEQLLNQMKTLQDKAKEKIEDHEATIKQLEDDLDELQAQDGGASGAEVEEMRQSLQHTQGELQRVREAEQQASYQVEELRAEVTQLNGSKGDLEGEKVRLTKELETVRAMLQSSSASDGEAQLKEEIVEAKKKIDNQNELLRSSDMKVADLEDQLWTMEDQKTELEEELAKVKAAQSSADEGLQSRAEALERHLADAQARVTDLEGLLGEARQSLSQPRSDEALSHILEPCLSHIQEQAKNTARTEEKIRRLAEALRMGSDDNAKVATALAALTTDVKDLLEKNSGVIGELVGVVQQLRDSSQKSEQADAQSQALKSQIESLQQEFAERINERDIALDEVRQQLATAQSQLAGKSNELDELEQFFEEEKAELEGMTADAVKRAKEESDAERTRLTEHIAALEAHIVELQNNVSTNPVPVVDPRLELQLKEVEESRRASAAHADALKCELEGKANQVEAMKSDMESLKSDLAEAENALKHKASEVEHALQTQGQSLSMFERQVTESMNIISALASRVDGLPLNETDNVIQYVEEVMGKLESLTSGSAPQNQQAVAHLQEKVTHLEVQLQAEMSSNERSKENSRRLTDMLADYESQSASLAELQEKYDQLANQKDGESARVQEEANTRVLESRQMCQTLEQKCSEFESLLAQAQDRVRQLENEVQVAKEQAGGDGEGGNVGELRLKIMSLEEEIEDMKYMQEDETSKAFEATKEAERLAQQLEVRSQEVEASKRQTEAVEQSLKGKEHELSQVLEEKQQLHGEIETLNAKISEHENMVSQLNTRVQTLEGHKQELLNQLERAKEEIRLEIEKSDTLQTNTESLQEDIEDMRKVALEKDYQLVEARQENELLVSKLDELENQGNPVAELAQQQMGEINALKQERDALQGQMAEVQNALESTKSELGGRLETSSKQHLAEVADLESRLESAQEEGDRIRESLEEQFSQQIDALKSQLLEARRENERLQQQRAEQDKQLLEASTSASDANAQLLEELQQRLEEERRVSSDLRQKVSDEAAKTSGLEQLQREKNELEQKVKILENLVNNQTAAAPAITPAAAAAAPLQDSLSAPSRPAPPKPQPQPQPVAEAELAPTPSVASATPAEVVAQPLPQPVAAPPPVATPTPVAVVASSDFTKPPSPVTATAPSIKTSPPVVASSDFTKPPSPIVAVAPTPVAAPIPAHAPTPTPGTGPTPAAAVSTPVVAVAQPTAAAVTPAAATAPVNTSVSSTSTPANGTSTAPPRAGKLGSLGARKLSGEKGDGTPKLASRLGARKLGSKLGGGTLSSKLAASKLGANKSTTGSLGGLASRTTASANTSITSSTSLSSVASQQAASAPLGTDLAARLQSRNIGGAPAPSGGGSSHTAPASGPLSGSDLAQRIKQQSMSSDQFFGSNGSASNTSSSSLGSLGNRPLRAQNPLDTLGGNNQNNNPDVLGVASSVAGATLGAAAGGAASVIGGAASALGKLKGFSWQ